jgi:DNA polymerase III sliding clamp (beta) subunit (PCNA family)
MGNVLKASDLHKLLTEAKSFAGSDVTLPMLTCIKLEATETQIVGVATDRFVLGATRVDYAGEAFTALLDKNTVDTLIKMSKTDKRSANWREVTLEIRETELEFRFTTGEALTVRPADYDFPKWRQLLPGNDYDDAPHQHLVHSVTVAAYNAAYLARFGKVAGSHQMRIFTRASKPALVTIGDDFVGMIMPVRMADGIGNNWVQPEWVGA